uniref:Uncharacterized protein n=1 Tax=Myoviridae sp. ctZgq1 TaxID=2826666 RepID=A0A8S5LXT9_9CAUD|nr:MAG TPA: hypothetical protein [Myoviridae sp. ctZgq1]
MQYKTNFLYSSLIVIVQLRGINSYRSQKSSSY